MHTSRRPIHTHLKDTPDVIKEARTHQDGSNDEGNVHRARIKEGGPVRDVDPCPRVPLADLDQGVLFQLQ